MSSQCQCPFYQCFYVLQDPDLGACVLLAAISRGISAPVCGLRTFIILMKRALPSVFFTPSYCTVEHRLRPMLLDAGISNCLMVITSVSPPELNTMEACNRVLVYKNFPAFHIYTKYTSAMH